MTTPCPVPVACGMVSGPRFERTGALVNAAQDLVSLRWLKTSKECWSGLWGFSRSRSSLGRS